MEKSIESIWKEGFLKNDALIAPKVNNLYRKKSIDIVEKFKRMYKINILAMIGFAIFLLLASAPSEMPYMGIPMFLLFGILTGIALKFKRRLNLLDNSLNSYEYLKSFEQWTKEMMEANIKISRFMYPYIALAMLAGFWFGSLGGNIPGNDWMNEYILNHPETLLLFGIPMLWIVVLLVLLATISYMGSYLAIFDINIVYGRILHRLKHLLKDMDELRL